MRGSTTGVQPRPFGQRDVWVRRCQCCGTDDLHAAYGDLSMIDADHPWRCRTCLAGCWLPASVALPSDDRAPLGT